MTRRMLIDASHAEETRVAVLDGNRLEDFDVETQSRKQLKGNIYLAKVVRVEPSLQAAFVEYGGNRHGFLAFGEIHPDYYQIPVADRQRLLAMQEAAARAQDDDEPEPHEADGRHGAHDAGGHDGPGGNGFAGDGYPGEDMTGEAPGPEAGADETAADEGQGGEAFASGMPMAAGLAESAHEGAAAGGEAVPTGDMLAYAVDADAPHEATEEAGRSHEGGEEAAQEQPAPDLIGGEGDPAEEARHRRDAQRLLRAYKIQEVIRRRQILLVQVTKEERGTKGAALTTYISLAGRFCVLMPNSPSGGGVSRKITSAADRRRLKEITAELEIPRGMGVIVRTAGANRPKPEIKRDCEYLLRLWDDIREHTLRSIAPAQIYEEASLIKRAIRDLYSSKIDEVLVEGEAGWRAAHEFMRQLVPADARKVQLAPSDGLPLFARHGADQLLDALMEPTVPLRSGGYLVINQTEALVAIDVNSGRSTRERNIEETALRTNLEAAEEVARQLRLRDLAGLIVIDFIDMESRKHNAMVERRLKDALDADRARIQVGHISHFGLMEMSRQRLRPSIAESSLVACVHCNGTGLVRSTESAALHLLRAIEDEAGRHRAAEILVHVEPNSALYLMNQKRGRLAEVEARAGLAVRFAFDASLLPGVCRIERVRARSESAAPAPILAGRVQAELPPPREAEGRAEARRGTDEARHAGAEEIWPEGAAEAPLAAGVEGAAEPGSAEAAGSAAEAEETRRRRRRRRRRTGSGREASAPVAEGAEQPELPPLPTSDEDVTWPEPAEAVASDAGPAEPVAGGAVPVEAAGERAEAAGTEGDEARAGEETAARSRRGRRGGRRRRSPAAEEATVPAYVGPTPADPFGLAALEVFDPELEEDPLVPSVPPPVPPTPEAAPGGVVPGPGTEPGPAPGVAESEAAESDHARAAASPVPRVDSAKTNGASAGGALPERAIADAAVPDGAGMALAEPAGAPAVAGPPAAPVVQPILVGSTEAPAQKKRGWWRR